MGREPAAARPLTVSELNREARMLLERRFPEVWVRGEVSRPVRASSGHLYFALKDQGARVDAVLFARQAAGLSVALEDGAQVLVRGRVTVYPPQGRYQVICESVQPAGEGALRAAMLRLKKALEAEGLLDPSRKRPLPLLPRAVGLVTSPSGAAVQDLSRTILQRFPSMRIVLCPVRVQGEGAAAEVARGMERVARVGGVDVVVVGRGGGSLEDLWTFNEETVVRAVAACPVPVVSAVGHEIDVTLADLVADARAATPTGAGVMVVPRLQELLEGLGELSGRLKAALHRELRTVRVSVDTLGRRAALRMFPRLLDEEREGLDLLERRRLRAVRARLDRSRELLTGLRARLVSRAPLQWVRERRSQLQGLLPRVHGAVRTRLAADRLRVQPAGDALRALNPLAVLARGFSVTRVLRDGREEILRDAKQAARGAVLRTTLAHGGDLLSQVVEQTGRGLPGVRGGSPQARDLDRLASDEPREER